MMKKLRLLYSNRYHAYRLHGIRGIFTSFKKIEKELRAISRKKQNKLRKPFKKVKDKRYFKLIQKQRGMCAVCGYAGKLTIDHKKKLADGGSSGMHNLQLLCEPCHRRKDGLIKK